MDGSCLAQACPRCLWSKPHLWSRHSLQWVALTVRQGKTSPAGCAGCELTRPASEQIKGGYSQEPCRREGSVKVVMGPAKSAKLQHEGRTSVGSVTALLALAANAGMLADAAAKTLLAPAPDAVMLAYARSPAFLALAPVKFPCAVLSPPCAELLSSQVPRLWLGVRMLGLQSRPEVLICS